MPFSRPTLSDLKAQVAADVQANLQGVSALLRNSVLRVITVVQAGLAYLHYGYLDWIAKQAVPWTATDEYLVGWGALKNVYQKGATPASGTATFQGSAGVPIPSGTTVVRGDGRTYVVQASGAVGGGGSVTVALTDSQPGAAGNCDAGTVLSLGTAIPGIQSSGVAAAAFTGGADVENTDALRTRVIAAFQSVPQGGDQNDYILWATAVPGVSRAWCAPNGFGAGTVVLYFMMDQAESAHSGFPQGTNGVASSETRTAGKATGDQLIVANAIYEVQPVTALMYACAPNNNPVNFSISGLSTASSSTRAAVSAAISDVFLRKGSPGGTVDISDINSGIAAVPGTSGFVITVPAGNIVSVTGYLPTLGTVTFS
ncbi:baseplate J/gp47 family protein [Burkholderia arboris]|uniref:baseplate J/gp47 family protein n=1 Tax=Burkholderia arboris TaxID=488730 RepID=UPI001CF545D0|nr:baseplate J/gp47 family protein [Burkholderia arboris]MCA8045469.1 baseplate J/gp47 family protein [Burkholderia arboris]